MYLNRHVDVCEHISIFVGECSDELIMFCAAIVEAVNLMNDISYKRHNTHKLTAV